MLHRLHQLNIYNQDKLTFWRTLMDEVWINRHNSPSKLPDPLGNASWDEFTVNSMSSDCTHWDSLRNVEKNKYFWDVVFTKSFISNQMVLRCGFASWRKRTKGYNCLRCTSFPQVRGRYMMFFGTSKPVIRVTYKTERSAISTIVYGYDSGQMIWQDIFEKKDMIHKDPA